MMIDQECGESGENDNIYGHCLSILRSHTVHFVNALKNDTTSWRQIGRSTKYEHPI